MDFNSIFVLLLLFAISTASPIGLYLRNLGFIEMGKQKMEHNKWVFSPNLALRDIASSPAFQFGNIAIVIPVFLSLVALIVYIVHLKRRRRRIQSPEDPSPPTKVSETTTSSLDDLEKTLTPPPVYELPLPVFQPPGIDLTLPDPISNPIQSQTQTQNKSRAQSSYFPAVYNSRRISNNDPLSPSGPPPNSPPGPPDGVDEKQWRRRTLESGILRPIASGLSLKSSMKNPRAHCQRRSMSNEERAMYERAREARRVRMNMRLAAGYDGYRGN